MSQPLLTASYEETVSTEDTAAAYDSSLPAAASTPFILALVERACIQSTLGDLGEGEVTVGVRVSLEHLKPSPVGVTLRAEATLNGNNTEKGQYTWEVVVRQDEELVARATHERARVPIAAIQASLSKSKNA